MIRAAAVLLTLTPALALSYELPREATVPGGVKLIRLEDHGSAMPAVDVDGQRAMVIQDGAGWVAVIGIPLSAPLAVRHVVVHGGAGRQEIDFMVRATNAMPRSRFKCRRHR